MDTDRASSVFLKLCVLVLLSQTLSSSEVNQKGKRNRPLIP